MDEESEGQQVPDHQAEGMNGIFVGEMGMMDLQHFRMTVEMMDRYLDLVNVEDFDEDRVIETIKGWLREEAEGEPVRFLGILKLAFGQVALMAPEACCVPHAVEDMLKEVNKLIAARHGGMAN